ncbi:MAG: hypothetical protein EA424_06940 [Planctomycetaceae bacterium]|nr:MAG: hypothetical protein EA424_06940 [Planctomycetaceae bacterium]
MESEAATRGRQDEWRDRRRTSLSLVRVAEEAGFGMDRESDSVRAVTSVDLEATRSNEIPALPPDRRFPTRSHAAVLPDRWPIPNLHVDMLP